MKRSSRHRDCFYRRRNIVKRAVSCELQMATKFFEWDIGFTRGSILSRKEEEREREHSKIRLAHLHSRSTVCFRTLLHRGKRSLVSGFRTDSHIGNRHSYRTFARRYVYVKCWGKRQRFVRLDRTSHCVRQVHHRTRRHFLSRLWESS